MDHNADTQALEQIVGDMDGMESDRMFKEPKGTPKGVSITIDVTPKVEEEEDDEDAQELNKGGVVEDESGMPPFLRSKKC